MDKVAGFLEIDRTDDTHKIVISVAALKPDANGLGDIVLSARQARHLANVLIDNATYAEAESAGLVPGRRAYRRSKRVRRS